MTPSPLSQVVTPVNPSPSPQILTPDPLPLSNNDVCAPPPLTPPFPPNTHPPSNHDPPPPPAPLSPSDKLAGPWPDRLPDPLVSPTAAVQPSRDVPVPTPTL